MLQYTPQMRVQIEDFNHDGRGRGRSGARAVLVPQTVPGDEVTVFIDRQSRGAILGRPVEWHLREERSRIDHPCPHEGSCTGCTFLALEPSLEAEWKRLAVGGALARAGVKEVEIVATRPGELFGYRQYSKASFMRSENGVALGAYVQGTHELAEVTGCPVLHEELSVFMKDVADMADALGLPVHGSVGRGLRHAVCRRSRATGDLSLALISTDQAGVAARSLGSRLIERHKKLRHLVCIQASDDSNVLLEGKVVHEQGVGEVREQLLDVEHRVSATAFFQMHPEASEFLFSRVCDWLPTGATVIEGYCGSGALTVPLTQRGHRVHGIESHPEAIANLRARTIPGLTAECAIVGDVLGDRLMDGSYEVGIFDPPRSGLGEAVARTLASDGPPILILVHCGLGALERDVRTLVNGGYGVERVLAVDQFTRTPHIEVLTELRQSPDVRDL